MWQVYVRLCVIDLALRVAAHIRLAGASPGVLDFLDSIKVSRRGAYLNKRRDEAGLPLECFAELAGVSSSAVEAWLYHGARPSDDRLVGIAKALASKGEPSEWQGIARELRRFYWMSDVSRILGDYIGAETVGEIVGRLHKYDSLVKRLCRSN